MRKIKRDKDTEEFMYWVDHTFDNVFENSWDFELSKPSQILIFDSFLKKVYEDEKNNKYRKTLVKHMICMLTADLIELNTFKKHALIKKGRVH